MSNVKIEVEVLPPPPPVQPEERVQITMPKSVAMQLQTLLTCVSGSEGLDALFCALEDDGVEPESWMLGDCFSVDVERRAGSEESVALRITRK